MRRLPASMCIVLLALGCDGQGDTEGQQPKGDADAEPLAAAIESTLQAILGDLVQFKDQWPQLADIEGVQLADGGFSYSKGLQSPIKAPEVKFDENGCHITVEIAAYQMDDRESVEEFTVSARAWDHFETRDGFRYAIWTLVLAEGTEPGKRLKAQVETLISNHLEILGARVQSEAIEFNPRELPSGTTE